MFTSHKDIEMELNEPLKTNAGIKSGLLYYLYPTRPADISHIHLQIFYLYY